MNAAFKSIAVVMQGHEREGGPLARYPSPNWTSDGFAIKGQGYVRDFSILLSYPRTFEIVGLIVQHKSRA